jgi:molecular chaperone GrpE (heat shock protein)
MVKSRSSAILSVALVFLSGALVGAVANRLYMVSTVSSNGVTAPQRPDISPEERRKHLVAEMQHEVKLDDQQVKQLQSIYDQTLEEFNGMHKRWDAESRAARDKQTEEIKAILRPDQLPLFDALRAKHDAERKARQANKDHPHPPR